jgi:hypothetical protein
MEPDQPDPCLILFSYSICHDTDDAVNYVPTSIGEMMRHGTLYA